MAQPSIGLPSVIVSFRTAAGSAITRSSRGKVALILNDENYKDSDGVVSFDISEASDIPATGISEKNVDLIKKTLIGAPAQIFAFLIPPATYEEEQEVTTEETVSTTTMITSDVTITTDTVVQSEVTITDPETGETSTVTSDVTVETETTVQSDVEIETTTVITSTTISSVTVTATVTVADALKEVANIKANYVAYPTGGADGQESLASFVNGQRKNRHKTIKAVVANCAADSRGVINFTTGNIKVANPDYTSALEAVDGDAELVDESIPKYKTYTAAEYTGRIAGIAAGIALDRSLTYYTLSEVVSCGKYADADAAVNNGELILIDEKDGLGVKIGRGVNSLINFSSEVGESFRYIKIVEALDLIQDDITISFKENYLGKVPNNYTNRMLFVSAVNTYLGNLKGPILDNAPSALNEVHIDLAATKDWATRNGVETSGMSDAQIEEISCGTNVFLSGNITPVNAMEDLRVDFVL